MLKFKHVQYAKITVVRPKIVKNISLPGAKNAFSSLGRQPHTLQTMMSPKGPQNLIKSTHTRPQPHLNRQSDAESENIRTLFLN